MPVYIVTGKLGSGKTLSMVGRLRDYIEAGKPVASNIDLDIRQLVVSKPKAPVMRLPDRPTVDDFEALGQVHDTGREELNGAIVLDECGTWLNSRTWSDKGRQQIIDWFLHSRKFGWDVYLIIQNISLLDKQVRDALAEYCVVCRRMDRLKIPFIGRFVSWITHGMVKGVMPKVHVASVRYGLGPASMHADTWWFRGKELYGAYQTVQRISDVSPGLHSLVWYATAEEIKNWPPKPKPRLRAVDLAARLPRDEAWALARRYVAALPSRQTVVS